MEKNYSLSDNEAQILIDLIMHAQKEATLNKNHFLNDKTEKEIVNNIYKKLIKYTWQK